MIIFIFPYTVRTRRQERTEIRNRYHRRADRPPQHASANRRRSHTALNPSSPAKTSTRQYFPTINNNIIIIINALKCCVLCKNGGGH